ncbi:hypothetical protein COS77_02030 [Candidatus Roizmanbacteria bacterium CG06_land_8_20_14_3_00_34_14]|uniref:Uncharacterized protein n=3 Tax=Candidatus Roizmaniibacteriota TaxID=1752723 RepID=A0A2M7AUN5_9BACT|nr:MAG: hypothetical protein COT02_03570 [Candidatus Roizmanbacteria bacterium CG07_land_8_20_14_0_80_34_15]PIU74345.1 MAG: hypothetical protein COS77_02030 [Candidatus Roizmanbacteria bacterium CG06_land_8_20_14_3_00_34_14]
MFKQELGFYLGNEKPDGFSGFVDENNLFLTVEIEAGITPDIGRELTFYIREKIRLLKIENLQQFDIFISNIIKEKNLPSGFSFSAGYLKGDIFYLKTINQGKIYIRRNNKLVLLIDSDKTASGFIKIDDVFVFTFSNFVRLLGGEEGLNNKFDHRPIPKIIDEITPELLTKDDHGTAALFLQLKKIDEEEKPIDNFFEVPKKLGSALNLKSYYIRFGQQKILTFITVFILGLILFWSVGIGVIRRKSENNQKKINLTKELISQKLSQAEEVSFLNMSSALSLIADSKDEANKIKKELGVKSYELSGIDKIISDSENKILKKEEKKYSEFFDLTVDDKNAKGDKIYLNDDNLLVSDKSRGVLYEFSLTKKSLDKDQSIEIKKSSLIALFEDKKYFYVEGAGVYQMVDGKAKKVIENDKEWGKIIDLVVFNGNIYLLDQGKNEIWKYMSAELGFGGKNSYFQPDQSFNLSSVNSFSIDGSVYIAGDSIMFKFTSGLQDAFKTNLPDDNIDVNKIFTTKDLEKVYGWDKKRGTIYIMGKNGNYQEQVNSKILSTASDFVVHKEIIYVIQGSKIYKIE